MPVWVKDMHAEEKYTKPPHARYTEASLIKKLDDLGIGRPSTYATMIKKVQEEQARQFDMPRKNMPTENDMGPIKNPKKGIEEGLTKGMGGKALGLKKGGSVSSASKRADGCATKGKTRGRII